MVSNTSKILPFASLSVILFAMVMSALGYAELINTLVAALPVLTVLAGGGLYAKHVEAGIEKYKQVSNDPNVKKLIDMLLAEAQKKEIVIKNTQ